MKTQIHTLLAFAAIQMAGNVLAAGDKHDHSHERKPLFGGVVAEAKDIEYEMVAKPTIIQLHLRDHGKTTDISKATAKIILLSGSDKQEFELQPVGDKFETTGNFKIVPGAKAVATVTIGGKVSTVRFTFR
jgi:hypothetical protein